MTRREPEPGQPMESPGPRGAGLGACLHGHLPLPQHAWAHVRSPDALGTEAGGGERVLCPKGPAVTVLPRRHLGSEVVAPDLSQGWGEHGERQN